MVRSTPGQRELYKSALRAALLKGHDVLSSGGTAMDAAVAAVVSMEGIYGLIPQSYFISNSVPQIVLCSTVPKELFSTLLVK
jgi:hypothetical protein